MMVSEVFSREKRRGAQLFAVWPCGLCHPFQASVLDAQNLNHHRGSDLACTEADRHRWPLSAAPNTHEPAVCALRGFEQAPHCTASLRGIVCRGLRCPWCKLRAILCFYEDAPAGSSERLCLAAAYKAWMGDWPRLKLGYMDWAAVVGGNRWIRMAWRSGQILWPGVKMQNTILG